MKENLQRNWRKIPFDEIACLFRAGKGKQLLEELWGAFEDEEDFCLKVEKGRENGDVEYHLWIWGKVEIDLVRVPKGHLPMLAMIAPHEMLAGQIEDRRQDGRAPVFYVAATQFGVFCDEAGQIHAEYCQNGHNFGVIPSRWFEEMELIQFIKNVVETHSFFQSQMESRLPAVMNWQWARSSCSASR